MNNASFGEKERIRVCKNKKKENQFEAEKLTWHEKEGLQQPDFHAFH